MIFIIVGILLVILFWIVAVQRRLVDLEQRMDSSLSQIAVQTESRWDALGALADTTKNYAEHEHSTLISVIKNRNSNPSSVEAITADDAAFRSTLSKLNVVAEAYPQLKSADVFTTLMNSLNSYENKVRTSRMVYNEIVSTYNTRIRQIPTCIIAPILGFGKRDYFQNSEAKKGTMPVVNTKPEY